jgi:hypothetical protein
VGCRAGSGHPSRATGNNAVSLFGSHSHQKVVFRRAGSLDVATPQPQLPFLETFIMQAGLRVHVPHYILSTAEHKFS